MVATPYSVEAQDALLAGQMATAEQRAGQFGPEALLLGLLDDPEGPASRLLLALGADPDAVRRDAARAVAELPALAQGTEVTIASSGLRAALGQAEVAAVGVEVGPAHLLLGLLTAGSGPDRPASEASRVLAGPGVTPDGVRRAIARRDAPSGGTNPRSVPPPRAAAPGTEVAAAVEAALIEALRTTRDAAAAAGAALRDGDGVSTAERGEAATAWLERAPALLERLGRLRGLG